MENKKDTPGVEKSDVARREEEMLAFWNEHDIFNKSLEKDAPKGDFVFYDGPPFATGLPHYGHILAGTIKDAIPRFWTMNGYRVERKWGWDCHGLPLENLIEKKLGLATKRDIEELGVKQFNEAARDAVLEYADDWKKIVPRMGRFVDMEDDYKTMDPSYTETVWWIFSELNKKGLVYEGFKSMHLCPRCGTTLSNFEVNQGYKDIKDIAVTVKLPLKDEEGNVTDTSLLVWTTTPWTLPGNMAAAVNNDVDYVKVSVLTSTGPVRVVNGDESGETKYEKVILANERLAQLGTDDYDVLETFKGSELVGKSYEPPFDYFLKEDLENKESAWKIYHADYVEIGEEGTGAVHLAPAYGEEDMVLAQQHNVPIVHHVDESGRFKDMVADFAGHLVKPKDDDESGVTHLDADLEVLRKLQDEKKIFRKENITHSYPHCWRCDTPLLNYATTSWFVKVTDLKDKLVEENNDIHWVPEHVGRSRFGKWLEGARDWAISRQRYWGAPLPIWRNPQTKEYKVIGSLDELKERAHKSGNKYLLMRHGESVSNLNGVVSSNKENDDPLTEAGREQVITSVTELGDRNIDLIIHSGFMRTKMTAEMVAEKLAVSEVIEDDRIAEVQMVDSFEGKTWDEYNDLFENWNGRFLKNIEGFENRRDVQKRMGAFMYDLNQKYKGKTILIVSHAGALFGLECAVQGLNVSDAKKYHDESDDIYLKNAEVRELPFTPIPHNDNFELDYHRPYIDDTELFDDDGTKLERVPDVFDCWFESGSMPYGQNHYPFENTESFEPNESRGYPANFIAEGLDQTRGWFYSLIVLGTALFDRSPYENVIVNGLVLAEDGKKMSKRLQNYPDPVELVDRVGADAMRFYLLSSPIVKGEDLNFSEKEVLELQRKNLGRLHNVLAMYEQYTDERIEAEDNSDNVLDQWIIARLNELINETTNGFKNYELDKATRPVTDFIDDLSVWYLRRSRDRIKGNDVVDRHKALATLRYILKTLSLVIAPSMPFYAEYLFRQVREDEDAESVHLMRWPDVAAIATDIVIDMATAREIVTKAHEARAKAGIKVRQPIASVTGPLMSTELQAIILDEINAKSYAEGEEVAIDTTITPELKAEGDAREFIRQVQDARKKKGLNPEDRIVLGVSPDTAALVKPFEEFVLRTVGATEMKEAEVTESSVRINEKSFGFNIVS